MPFGPKHYAHTSEVYAKPSYLVPNILLRGLKVTELTVCVGNVQICFRYFIIYKALLSHPLWKLHSIGAKLCKNVMAGKVYIPDYTIIIQ